jgi:hypothetical protein
MRKYLILFLILALLCPVSAAAAEAPKFVVLTFGGIPAGAEGRFLLDGLSARDARATFFLWAAPWEQGRRVLDGNHEIGLMLPDSLNQLSRRQVAAKLRGARALMPPCRVRFLMTEDGCSDGVAQVARVLRFSFPEAPLCPGNEGFTDTGLLDQVQNGDTLYFPVSSRTDVSFVLNAVDRLQSRGFLLITASEMNRLRRLG